MGLDGAWAYWNAVTTLESAKFLDLSPYNFYSGTGSIFVPNLPWLNPGALALGLPYDATTRQLVSMCVYALMLGTSIFLVGKTLGLPTIASAAAAQLHIAVFFPPFFQFFKALEWYAATPMYAALSTMLNLILCCLVLCGKSHRSAVNAAYASGISILALVGLTTSVLAFPFFVLSYSTALLVILFASSESRKERTWKLCACICALIIIVGFGFPDYYAGTAATSARTPSRPVQWGLVLSPTAWLELIRTWPLCDFDPRALFCPAPKNYFFYFQIAALGGAWVVLIDSLARRRKLIGWLAGWYIAYVFAHHLYALVYQSERIGWLSVFSSHFFIWPSYTFAALFCVAGIGSLIKRLGGRLKMSESMLACDTPVFRRATVVLISAAVVYIVLLSFSVVSREVKRIHRGGGVVSEAAPSLVPLVKRLRQEAAVPLGTGFRGYTISVWEDSAGSIRKAHPSVIPKGDWHSWQFHHAVNALNYVYIGNSLSEMSLWLFNIPTFEEYGQWVSRQLFTFVKELLAPPGADLFVGKLRVMSLDAPLLKALGVRFVITNELQKDTALRHLMSQKVGPYEAHLYELDGANLANFSPLIPILAHSVGEAFEQIRLHHNELDRYVVVSRPISGSLVSASRTNLAPIKDGVRFVGESTGRSLVLLPVQYSHCLVASDPRVKLHRGNIVQTIVEFEGWTDTDITFEFGLFGKGKCRIKDGLDLQEMKLQRRLGTSSLRYITATMPQKEYATQVGADVKLAAAGACLLQRRRRPALA